MLAADLTGGEKASMITVIRNSSLKPHGAERRFALCMLPNNGAPL